MRHQPKVKLFFYCLMMALSQISFALPTDKEQVLHVIADSANLSQQNHKGIYTGNVAFQQGTTNIQAANAITEGSAKNELTLAIINGDKNKQAHYWTDPGDGKPPLHAYADKILYYPLKHLIELNGNAHIEQGKNSMSAAIITYDTVEQHVVSQSNGKTRTTIILYPDKKTS